MSEQKNNFPSLEKRIVETALVFLPKLVRETTSIVSEFQTIIRGLAPIDPLTTNFLYGHTPRDIISSENPLASFTKPSPKNLCFKVLTFITTPIAAAG